MPRSKLFSLFTWINGRLEFKIIAWLFLVCAVFLSIASAVSYQHTFTSVQNDSKSRIDRLARVVESNAAIASYLNDFSLASEIINGLGSSPEIQGIIFTLSSGVKLTNGEVKYNQQSDIHIDLHTKFEPGTIGTLDIFLNSKYINEQAKDKGLSLVIWEMILILTILACFLIIFRFFVYYPLNDLVSQIRMVKLGPTSNQHFIEIKSKDEMGFLADNMNMMIGKIHDSYALEVERNERIAHLERQFRMIFENSHAGIALINAENKVLISNHSFTVIFQKGEECCDDFYYAPDLFEEHDDLEQVLSDVRTSHKNIFRDFKVADKDDVWVRALFSIIEDTDGDVGQFVEMVLYDISDRAKQERRFEYNATHDALTGLLNRRGGDAKFAQQLAEAKRHNHVVAVALIDLNDFKPVNDKYGHEAGDIVLKEISSRLRSFLRSDDIIVRWGGDEFVISFVLDQGVELDVILHNIQTLFDKTIEISSDISVSVGASIGISTSDRVGYDIDTLLEKADDAMYEVKRSGKSASDRVHDGRIS